MGNLGTYQAMTTLAKKLGGPKALLAVTAVTGYTVLRPAEAGIKRALQAIRKRYSPCIEEGAVFTASADGDDGSGFAIRQGDEYRVLERDGEAVLVEVIGHPDNPYFVSGSFLASISDFPWVDAAESQ